MDLHHEIVGTGPAVLLTHGFGASSHMFASTVAALAVDHTVISWDMRGHGASAAPDEPGAYSVAASLDDMTTLLDDAGARRAVLLGHSLGGYLSLELALAQPERAAGLVLVDTGPGYRSDRGRDAWNAMTEDYARALEERGLAGLPGSEELRTSVHSTVTGLVHSARSTLRQADGHVMDSLSTIVAPTLLVVGSRDTPFVPGSEHMAAKIPNATLAVIDGAGHAPTVTHPEATNEVIRTFLVDHDL